MSIHNKILSDRDPVVLFEIVPPPSTMPIIPTLKSVGKMMRLLPIDALNIPEILPNKTMGEKHSARDLAAIFKKKVNNSLPIIINRPVVYQRWDTQKKWFAETYKKYVIDTVVLVGGEKGEDKYPGPTVCAAAELINKDLQPQNINYLLGGITIPTRKREAQKVFEKSCSGISFFTSQVIFNAKPVKKLLARYARICKTHERIPRRIFLSFAPIARPSDLEFINGLRVDVPASTTDFLFAGWVGIGWRSIDVAGKLLHDILSFNKERQLNIPLGLNIEHIVRGNFELAYLLAQELIKIYNRYSL